MYGRENKISVFKRIIHYDISILKKNTCVDEKLNGYNELLIISLWNQGNQFTYTAIPVITCIIKLAWACLIKAVYTLSHSIAEMWLSNHAKISTMSCQQCSWNSCTHLLQWWLSWIIRFRKIIIEANDDFARFNFQALNQPMTQSLGAIAHTSHGFHDVTLSDPMAALTGWATGAYGRMQFPLISIWH